MPKSGVPELRCDEVNYVTEEQLEVIFGSTVHAAAQQQRHRLNTLSRPGQSEQGRKQPLSVLVHQLGLENRATKHCMTPTQVK